MREGRRERKEGGRRREREGGGKEGRDDVCDDCGGCIILRVIRSEFCWLHHKLRVKVRWISVRVNSWLVGRSQLTQLQLRRRGRERKRRVGGREEMG